MVLVETVGVGQSETEIAELADTVVFAVQPGSGDSLQFMKAGIVEIPDIALVTKADLGGIAERAKRDLEGALGLVPAAAAGWQPPVLLVSAASGQGIDAALDADRPRTPRPSRHAACARRRARRRGCGSSAGCTRSSAGEVLRASPPSLPRITADRRGVAIPLAAPRGRAAAR